MKKYSIVVIFLLLLLGGIASWYFVYREKAKPVVLETEKPKYGYISTSVTATGKVEPVDTVTIGSQVSGTIKKIYVDFNDRVKKGQLIAELDKSLYLTSVNQYSANLELARSNLLYQENNFKRQTQLYGTQVISRAEFENAQYQFESAKATVNSVRAQLDGAQKNLSYTNIFSPVNGVVLFRNISIGQTVAASFNTPTLFVIAKELTKMQVQAAVDEADIGNVKKGQWAEFTVDAYPDISFRGRIREIRLQPVVSANVVTYTTIVDAPNKDLKLKPGMTANIFIYSQEDSNALLISSRALRFTPDSSLEKQFKIRAYNINEPEKSGASMESSGVINPGNGKYPFSKGNGSFQTSRVWVKTGDTLTEKQIHTAINDDTYVQVVDGLKESDLVILGIVAMGKKSAAASPQKSPFMPTRRRTGTPAQGTRPTGTNR
jgi:HlyD family secretion protein